MWVLLDHFDSCVTGQCTVCFCLYYIFQVRRCISTHACTDFSLQAFDPTRRDTLNPTSGSIPPPPYILICNRIANSIPYHESVCVYARTRYIVQRDYVNGRNESIVTYWQHICSLSPHNACYCFMFGINLNYFNMLRPHQHDYVHLINKLNERTNEQMNVLRHVVMIVAAAVGFFFFIRLTSL